MSEIAAILEANRRYAIEHGTIDVPLRPARGLAILTCMDARIQLFPVLGLRLGDAHVIRNAGGRASDDAIRSLMVSTNLLGTREIIVMHHTDCGQHRFTDADIRAYLREHRGVDTGDTPFLTFTDLHDSVREDIATIRASPLLPPDIVVSGLIFDVATGQVHAVDVAGKPGPGLPESDPASPSDPGR